MHKQAPRQPRRRSGGDSAPKQIGQRFPRPVDRHHATNGDEYWRRRGFECDGRTVNKPSRGHAMPMHSPRYQSQHAGDL
jgi:hypothetical protein